MNNNKTNSSTRTFIAPVGLSVILNYKKEKKIIVSGNLFDKEIMEINYLAPLFY
jgi:hypothetical protein